MNLTLPTDSDERKEIPILRGCVNYFPAALAGVARISDAGNKKHNPGEELHHARGKSMDHGDCIVRHLMDIQDLVARKNRDVHVATPSYDAAILLEVSQLAWRALALSQELHEKYGGAPLAPGARLPAGVRMTATEAHIRAGLRQFNAPNPVVLTPQSQVNYKILGDAYKP